MNIEIINSRVEKIQFSYDKKIYRGTVLGNPYIMKNKTEDERDRVCDLYHDFFYYQIKHKKDNFLEVLKEFEEILNRWGELRLFCWCAPLRCHGDTIKNYLLNNKKP